MVVEQQVISAENFWKLLQSEHALRHVELIEGEIREMAPTGEEHGVIAGNIFGYLWQFVHQHQLGRVTAAETGYIVHQNPNGRDTVLAPDVAFTSQDRLPQDISSKFAPYAPDLVVEVVSPSDRADDIQEKVGKYLQYGTQLVWVIYPKTKEIVVHQENSSITLTLEDNLTAEPILQNFDLSLADIFVK